MKVQEHMQKNKTRVAYVGIPTKRCSVPSMLRNFFYRKGETSSCFCFGCGSLKWGILSISAWIAHCTKMDQLKTLNLGSMASAVESDELCLEGASNCEGIARHLAGHLSER